MSDQSQALQWAMAMEVDFVNMSFGFPGSPALALQRVLTAAHCSGIKLFAAAGNGGRNVPSIAYPAKATNVFAVFASGAWRLGWIDQSPQYIQIEMEHLGMQYPVQ